MNGIVFDPRLFDCPKCGAPSTHPCVPHPNAMTPCEPHQERINRAVKALADAVDALRGTL